MNNEGMDFSVFPSLELVYEHAKEAIKAQEALWDALDAKLVQVWGIATAIVGIVIPIALTRNDSPYWGFLPAVGIWALCTVLAAQGYLPKQFGAIDDVTQLKKSFVTLSKERFMSDYIQHIEGQYKHDTKRLERKGQIAKAVLVLLMLEVVAILIGAIFL